MGRAEAKLERAGAALEKARLAVENFDAWADNQRQELMRQADEAEQWYRWREHQLNELHEEAGEKAQGRREGSAETPGSKAAVSGRILGDLLPRVHEILEQMQGNPEVVERLAQLAAGLESAWQELHSGGGTTAEQFDIGSDAVHDACDGGPNQGAREQGEAGKAGHGGQGPATVGWEPEGPGRWTRARPGARRTGGRRHRASGGQ
jgi:hypothetical protein